MKVASVAHTIGVKAPRRTTVVLVVLFALICSLLTVDDSVAGRSVAQLPKAPTAAAAQAPALQPGAGQFVPVQQALVINGVALAAAGVSTATVTGANGVPAASQVSAVAVQVTAIGATGNGYIQTYASGTTRPVDSTTNFVAARNSTSYDVVPISAAGQISVYSNVASRVWVRLRGYYTSATATTAGSTFVPLPPTTVVNNVPLATNGSATYTLAGVNGIPIAADVSAVALDLAAVTPSAAGQLKAYPAGTAVPAEAAVYYSASQSQANYETVQLSAAGQVTFTVTGATKLAVRLRGYYARPSTTVAGSSYLPVPRFSAITGVVLGTGGTTTATLTGANGIPAPSAVAAIAANVVASAATVAGYLQSYPAGTTRPSDATVQYASGTSTGQYDTIRLSSTGQATFYASGATNMHLRLRGYYKRATVPLAPTAVTATAGDASATVSWTRPKDGGAAITGYTITASPGGIKATVGPETSGVVAGLTKGTAYTFTVQATNIVGTGAASTPSQPITPLGGEVTYANDAAGRLKAVFGTDGAGVVYHYDAVGNVTSTESLPANQLKVVQSGPSTVITGDSYEIYATGVGVDPAQVSVKVGSVVAPIKTLRKNHVVVTVPAGARSGPVILTVAGTTVTAGSVAVLLGPQVTTISPAIVDRGAAFTVSGSNFVPTTSGNTVSLNGTKLQVLAATATSLSVRAPGFPLAGKLTVRTRAGSATSATRVTVPPSPFLVADVAASAQLSTGTPATITLTASNQIALFTIDANAGQRLGFEISETISGCYEAHILAPDRTAVVADESVCGGALLELPRAAQAGTYLVELDPRDPVTGTFTALASQGPDVLAEIAIDGPVGSVTTTAAPTHATFTFTGTKGQLVFTTLTAQTRPADGAVMWGPHGQKLSTTTYFLGASEDAYLGTVLLPETGTYMIDVDPDGFQVGTYTAQVTAVPAAVSATTSIDGPAGRLTISKPGQTGSVSFAGTQGQLVHLNLVLQLTSNSSGKATLRGPDGSFLLRDRGWNTFLDTDVDHYVLPQTGEYLVLLEPFGAQTGTIDLAINTIPADVVYTTAVDAAAKAVGNTVAGQSARLTFAATVGQRVLISCEAMAGHDYDLDYELLNPAGSRVDTDNCTSTDKGILFDTRAMTAGTWTVVVNPERSLLLSPLLRVVSVPDDTVVSTNLGSTATMPLAPGQNGSITTPLAAGQRFMVGCSVSDLALRYDIAFELIRPDGTRAATGHCDSTSDGFVFDTVTSTTAGTWTVRVDPQVSSATTVTLRPIDVPADVAVTATVGGAAFSFDTVAGQNAVVSFTATSGQRVLIGCSLVDWVTKQYDVSFKLLRPDGTTEESTSCYESSGGMLVDTMALPTAGTWQVVVNPERNLTTRTTVRLYSVPADVVKTATVGGAGVSVATVVGQSARITFTGAASQKVKATVTASTFPSCAGSVRLQNSAGTQLTSTCLSLNGALTYTLPAAETYTILVDPQELAAGSATITVANSTTAAVSPGSEEPDLRRQTQAMTKGPAATAVQEEDKEPSAPVYPRVRDASLTGRILRTDGKPLAGVTAKVADRSVRTKADGSFVLKRLPQGTWLLAMDGRTASTRAAKYGSFDVQVSLRKGSNRLFYQPYLPILDTANEVAIASPTTEAVVIRTPKVKGLEVHIPAGVRITDADGKAVTRVGITPIPVDRTPIPMPKGVQVPVYFTVQPAGGELHGGKAKIHYPNYLDQKPGTELNFWTHEKYAEGWEVYGKGIVTADGSQVIPDADTAIENFDGAMINVDGWLEGLTKGLLEALGSAGDPVDLATGRFTYVQTDITLGGFIPIEAQRAYSSGDGRARPFGMGTIGTYDTFLTSTRQWQEADLNLIDGTQVHFVRTSPGSGFTDAAFAASGTFGQFAGSTLFWNGAGWDLKLRDGTVLIYGDVAPLQGIRDRFGHYVQVRRTAKNSHGNQIGAITSVTSSEGYWLAYEYNTAGQITKVTDNTGRSVAYTYLDGLLQTVTDVNGGVTTYGWETATKRLTSITDAKQQLFLTNVYDGNGRVKEQIQADGGKYLFAYTLDATGKKVAQTAVIDPSGARRTVDFDDAGYLKKETSAVGTSKERGYQVERDPASHLPKTTTDTNGRVITSVYNPDQQATSTTVTLGGQASQETATYNGPDGAMDSITDALGHLTSYTFDALGNVKTVTDPEGRKTSYEYDTDGQPIKETPDGAGSTTFDYVDGVTSEVTDALGRKTSFVLDLAGRVVETIAPDGGVASTRYDAANQVRSTKDPLGAVTSYSYDANGNLESLQDARGGTTTWTYDVMDRLSTATDQVGAVTRYTYTALGRPETITDRRGQITEFRYDELQREVFRGWGRTGTPGTYQYESTRVSAYDNKQRLESVEDSGTGKITFGYDERDRLTSETTPQGTITREYDDADRLKTTKATGLPDTVYDYDRSDRLKSVTRGTVAATYGYDSTGRPKTVTLPGGVVRTTDYDLAGAVTGLTFSFGTQTLGALTYGYDGGGRLNVAGGSWARTDLPVPVAQAEFDPANRLKSLDGVQRDYDPEGNLVSDGTSTYSWNARGELAATAGAAGVAQIRYDALGRRTGTTLDGQTWNLRYDGDTLLTEDGPGSQDATYLAGLEDDSAVARVDGLAGAGATSALLTDRLGSVIARTEPDSSNLAAEYTYGPYGVSRSSLSGDTNPVRFTGRESGPGLPVGLQFQRARWYEPGTGRFLSEDPAGFAAAGPNLYSYVGGAPTGATDPSGAMPQIVAACVGDAIVNTVAGVLLGRKHTAGDYLRGLAKGCADGVLIFGAAKFLSVGLRSARPATKWLDEAAESASRACSFSGETSVEMGDGSSKPISQVEVGNEVMATDPETGERGARKVTHLWVHTDTLLELEVDGGDLTTTEDHPFWNATDQEFERVDQLDPGDQLLAADGRMIRVGGIRPGSQKVATAYNLTVDGIHTYYVLAGPTPVLVHNSNGRCDATGRGLWQLTKEGASKIMKGGPFKTTFYKSSSDGTWWTPDVTGHGESAFKVYRETSKGLEWISDADKFGTYMPNKWKGETGRFIPKGDLRGVKG